VGLGVGQTALRRVMISAGELRKEVSYFAPLAKCQRKDFICNFDVLLTVHISIILVFNQLNTQNLVL